MGMIEQSILLGENWCSSDKAGKTFYLDAYFGVMRSGDQYVPIPQPVSCTSRHDKSREWRGRGRKREG